MGFAAFFKPGTLMQLIVVICLTMLYIISLVDLKPYTDLVDDRLAILNQAALFTTLLGALVVGLDNLN